MTPTVTIGIPTYNGAKYLRECLESVLGQSFTDLEVVLVDDCSSDSTMEIAADYAQKDARVSLRHNEKRLGLVGNFNRCLGLARGQYICIFGQDDVMLPGNLQRKVEVLNANPTVGFVHSNMYLIDGTGRILGEHWKTESTLDYTCNGSELLRKLIEESNHVCCPSVLARMKCFEQLGGFNDQLFFTCDWEMWMRLSLHYDVACLGLPLIKYRRHSGSESSRVFGKRSHLEQEFLAKQLILSRYGNHIQDVETLRRRVFKRLGERAFDDAREAFYQGDFFRCREFLQLAAGIVPGLIRKREYLRLWVGVLLGQRGVQAYRWVKAAIARASVTKC